MLHKRENRRVGLGLALLVGPILSIQCQVSQEPPTVDPNPVDTTIRLPSFVNQFYPIPTNVDKSRLLMPTDLEYRGAFKLPTATSGTSSFAYVAGAMTFYPKGDVSGSGDGYPGSLFAAGHISQMHVAEVDIPRPVISAGRRLAELPTAKILQPFRALGARPSYGGNPMMGLAYLPAQGSQQKDKLYVSQSDGYLPAADHKSYWISDVDFTNQVGPFRTGTDLVHCYSDFIFPVPKAWADKYSPGMHLMTGRHREGDLCGRGPALFTMAPWNDGDPPALDKPLTAKPVLRYPQTTGGLVNYSRGGDIYMDGAFASAGAKSSLIMVGQKGLSGGEYGTYCNYQGYHDLKGYRPYIIFYDADELGRAAKGEVALDKPMPYAGIDLNEYLMKPNRTECDHNNITAAAYDPGSSILYLLERMKETPVVHVFAFAGGQSSGAKAAPAPSEAAPAIAVTRGGKTSLNVSLPSSLRTQGDLKVRILDAYGRAVSAREESAGAFAKAFTGLRAGLYIVQVTVGAKSFLEKVVLAD